MPPGFGINLIASISGNIGLGVTARNMAGALRRHGVPFVICDVAHAWGDRSPPGDLADLVVRTPEELRYPVNLYVLPLVYFESLSVFYSLPGLLAAGRLHVASFWWEVSALPPAWIGNLSRFDAIIAASAFIANLAANQLELTPVIEAKHPLSLAGDVAADRARFGLPRDATVFAVSLDPNSDPARKNPFGAVSAFQMAFPAGIERVRLVIRLNNAATDLGRGTAALLQQSAGNDGRIELLLEPMNYDDILKLYASSDVYVSLHRGEGLGLGLMEAMALGKPVIATAWSGNMSFMDHDCGCLVRYRLLPVSGNLGFFRPPFIGPNACWADPLIEDAALWMRRLHEDPELRLRMGAAAKARIDEYQAEARGRRWIDELSALWQAQSFISRAPGKFSAMTTFPSQAS